MKKRRLLSIVLSLCMVMALMPQMVFAETTADGNFEYSVSEETNEVTITKYNGSAVDLVIPDNIDGKTVTTIGKYAFSYCTSIKSVTIPEGVTSIELDAFGNCTSLTSVTILDGVTSIGGAAFYNCTSLESVTIPDSVTSIGAEAFYNCTNLKNVTIPEGVTSIGSFAFYYCTSLESVTIPKGVTSIGMYTFINCTSLESITFEDHSQLTRIDDSAFNRCTSLKSVTIPEGVTHIGCDVFIDCTSLESIFLPDNDKLYIDDPSIPNTITRVKYSLDTEKGEVTITGITLGTDRTSVAIPATICGYPVVAVAASEQYKVGEHIHVGTATCKTEGICTICGKPYILPHDFSADKKTAEAIKTVGTCTTEAEYYYSCAVCDSVENDDNHIFTGAKDFNNHTGGTEIRGAKDATCTEEGYTGDTYCKGCETILYQGSSENKLKHDLVKTPAKEATAAETGNEEYWQCKDCQKYFSDAAGKTEITLDDTVISKLLPEIIEGKGQSITEGEKKALSFRSNALFEDFDRVELDGDTLDTEYYTAESGSIIVTLDADYVATLPVGEHTIGIVSESGTAKTTFTVAEKVATGTSNDSDKDSESDKDSAKTGDNANLALWLALMLLSGAGITGVTAYTRRKRTNE